MPQAADVFRNAGQRAWLTTLLSVLLAIAPGARAHLHLCFDGGEPPSSFHISDSEMHHDSGADRAEQLAAGYDTAHTDSDVAVTGDLLSKAKFEWSTPAAAPTPVLASPAPSVLGSPAPASVGYVPSAPPLFLRPPLRGPPSAISL